jgi:hypothetical protein
VTASLIYSGTPAVTDTFLGVFDSGLKYWFGSYTPKVSDPGGLWSLVVSGSDTSSPPNSGSATKAVTLQDRPPIASFTSTPSSAPTGIAINFNGTASYDPDGRVVSYSWDFGDQTTGTGSIVTHSYTYAKTYTVKLTVTDNGGVTGSTTSQVTISDRPPVVSLTPSPSTANTGQSITLSVSASDPDGTISSTRVDWGDTIIQLYSGAITSATHSYASTGPLTSKTFTIIITATDNNASYTSLSSQVTINDRVPTQSFNPSSTSLKISQNVTLTISATDPDGTLVSIKVDWGDGTIDTLSGTATSDIHSYSSIGTSTSKTFTIAVTVTDNSGSTSTPTTSAVNVQANSQSSSGNLSLPLYYFAILAAVVAALLVGGFLAFRRHKVTHARLKIDLEAVRSEAGRIENQEFFQSVKDQLKKDKDD